MRQPFCFLQIQINKTFVSLKHKSKNKCFIDKDENAHRYAVRGGKREIVNYFSFNCAVKKFK